MPFDEFDRNSKCPVICPRSTHKVGEEELTNADFLGCNILRTNICASTKGQCGAYLLINLKNLVCLVTGRALCFLYLYHALDILLWKAMLREVEVVQESTYSELVAQRPSCRRHVDADEM